MTAETITDCIIMAAAVVLAALITWIITAVFFIW